MITLLFAIGIIYLCASTGIFAIRVAWGMAKFVLFVIAFPLILIGLFVAGIMYLAIPLLIIGVIVSLVRSVTQA